MVIYYYFSLSFVLFLSLKIILFSSPTSTTSNYGEPYKHNHVNKEKHDISNNDIKQANNMENKNKNSKLNPGYFEIKPLSKDNYSNPSFIPASTQFYVGIHLCF